MTNSSGFLPATTVSLSKSPLINGRYRSRSDNSRMLIFQFEDDGSFDCDAVNPQTGAHIGMKVVRPWRLDIRDHSLTMSVIFHDPKTQVDIESEFAVIDSEWIGETWK